MAKNKNKTDFWRTIYIYLCTLLCSKCPECIGTSTGTVQYWYWYWYWYCPVLVLVLVLVLYSIGTSTGTVQYFVLSSIYFFQT